MRDRRPRRVGGLEMPTVDVMKDIRGRRRILPRRSAVLGQESPHLDHVVQASSQQFQGSVHVLQRLGTLRCHISASGSAAGHAARAHRPPPCHAGRSYLSPVLHDCMDHRPDRACRTSRPASPSGITFLYRGQTTRRLVTHRVVSRAGRGHYRPIWLATPALCHLLSPG